MLKVVIIDGNAISRNLLTSVLPSGGFEVVGDSNTSAAGITSMSKLHPQIICIDTGEDPTARIALLESVRNLCPKAMLFMVSGKMDPDLVKGALDHGVHGFIVKPFNAVTVLMTIRNGVIKLARQHASGKDA
jgi:two-component system chemotaxis response regulator CheY